MLRVENLKKTGLLAGMVALVIALTGCYDRKCRVLPPAAGSIIFQSDGNIQVLAVDGQPAELVEKLPTTAKRVGLLRADYLEGSCYVTVCKSGYPCRNLKISDGPCPPWLVGGEDIN